MNRRNRAGSFVLVLGAVCAHLLDTQGHGLGLPWAISLAVLHFLVYPQVLYALARRAHDPLRAEINNLRLDAFLFGVWGAALAFPLWISFAMVACTVMNLAAFRGTRGLVQATALVLAGAALGLVVWGVRFGPETRWPATAFSMVGLAGYMFLFARDVHRRTLKLRAASEKLLSSEASLQTANLALQQQLAEINHLQSRLQAQATHDALTGLHNRHHLDPAFERWLARCRHEGTPLAVVMLDIDHFKRVNDEHGHLAGDEVMRQLATVLRTTARMADVVCRYGGEEFLLLMANVDLPTAVARAESLRQQTEALCIVWGAHSLQVTASFDHGEVVAVAPVPAFDGAAGQAERGEGNDAGGVKHLGVAQAAATGARAVRRVEREQARLQLAQRVAAHRAGKF
jgi:diguanylate cyclase (GGDEF)-like protein